MKNYFRCCRICKNRIEYKTYKLFWQAQKRDSTCRYCFNKITSSISKIGEKNPMFGKHFTEEAKQKQRESHKGKKPYIMTDEIKKKLSTSKKGKPLYNNGSFKIGMVPWNKGVSASKETKEKNRIAQLKRLEYLKIRPTEDRGAGVFFEGLNKNGFDFKPKTFWNIGYVADGYDEKNHIWIEFDTPYHNRRYQSEKDLIRQNNIINYFESINKPLSSFIRIKSDKEGNVLNSVVIYGNNIII